MIAPSEVLHEDVSAPDGAAQPSDASEARERRNYDGLMRAQAEALNQITKQVIVTEPRPRDGVQSALSRLEARLAVTEQSLAALDQRLDERMKGLDGDTTALGERLHGLRQRLEKFEEKQLVALAQIRLDVHNLRHPQTREEPVCDSAAVFPEPVLETESCEPDSEEGVSEEIRAVTYLDTARKAAIEAAERAAAAPVKRKPGWKSLWRRKNWLAVALATVLVAWFDAYVFAHYQPAQGAISEPSQRQVQPSLSAREQLIRGLKYWRGSGATLDAERGKSLIERAASRGDPMAEAMMGNFAQTGGGANMIRAIGWYDSAARHGNRGAMTALGKLYAGAWKEGTDFAKAADWFAKAAAAGDVDAAFDLAILYERGLGRPRDIGEAYRWYAIASGSGDRNAASRATVLAGKIAPAERDGLDRAILAFKPVPLDRSANEVKG